MIFSSLYMSRGQTTNKPLPTTGSVEITEEPRTTPKGNSFYHFFSIEYIHISMANYNVKK